MNIKKLITSYTLNLIMNSPTDIWLFHDYNIKMNLTFKSWKIVDKTKTIKGAVVIYVQQGHFLVFWGPKAARRP